MKYKFIYQKWWKWLTLVLLLYVFIAGFLVPLKPGILKVSKFPLHSGVPNEVEVATYNTSWTTGDEIRAFLRYDSLHLWEFEKVSILGKNRLTINGVPPSYNSSGGNSNLTLILHHEKSGFMVLPDAFLLHNKEIIDDPKWVVDFPKQISWTWAFPFRNILYETIRNTFFHVAIWMAMFVLLTVSLVYSIRYLNSKNLSDDAVASSFAHVAVIWGMMGMITGSIWARVTWGTYWTNDPKLNMSAVAMMIYLAYSILRLSIADQDRRAQLSSAYNVFAFVAMIPLVFIIPRMTSSLHPGNGGNPALGGEDLDHTLRLIFYPAIIAYTLLGVWMASLLYRMRAYEIRKLLKQI